MNNTSADIYLYSSGIVIFLHFYNFTILQFSFLGYGKMGGKMRNEFLIIYIIYIIYIIKFYNNTNILMI